MNDNKNCTTNRQRKPSNHRKRKPTKYIKHSKDNQENGVVKCDRQRPSSSGNSTAFQCHHYYTLTTQTTQHAVTYQNLYCQPDLLSHQLPINILHWTVVYKFRKCPLQKLLMNLTWTCLHNEEVAIQAILHAECYRQLMKLLGNFPPGKMTSGKPIFRAIDVPATRCG